MQISLGEVRNVMQYKDSSEGIGRISEADFIFINANILLSDESIPLYLFENKQDTANLWGVGTKWYGNSNRNIYNRQFKVDYYNMTEAYLEVYEEYEKELENKEYYIDFIALVLKRNSEVSVFLFTNMYIS